MAEDKRFYWIKLKDTFMTSDTVDFLMGQKNGASYVVLYQMLCLKTVNTNGELARKIGEIIIPYDADKIQRDCKYFDIDTIRVALELYKQLGLIYKQEDSILKIANFENMVGSETAWAEKKRIYREKKDQLEIEEKNKDDVRDNVLDNFRQEKEKEKEKEKDIRYKDIRYNAANNNTNNKLNLTQAREELDEVFDFDTFRSITDCIYLPRGLSSKVDILIEILTDIYISHPELKEFIKSDRFLLGTLHSRFYEKVKDPDGKENLIEKDITDPYNYIMSILKGKTEDFTL